MRHDFLDTALKAAYHLAEDMRKVSDARGGARHHSELEAAVLLHDDETLSVEPFRLSEMERVVAVVRYYRSALITSETPV